MDEHRDTAYAHLVEAVGEEGARALMAMLPPSRWEDLATKADLREEIGRLDERLTGRLDAQDQRLDAQDQRLDALDERLTGRLDALGERLTGRLDAQGQQIRALEERVTGRLDAQDQQLGGRFDALEARLDTLQAVTVSSRQLGLTMIASVTAIGALAVTLAALT